MQLGKLLQFPWGFISSPIVDELLSSTIPEGFELTVRAQPEKWDVNFIADTYQLPTTGKIRISRVEAHVFCSPYFDGDADVKDGWKTTQCRDPHLAVLLGFLVPILNPSKQSRVTLITASQIIASFTRERLINWGSIITSVIRRQVSNLKKTGSMTLATYLPHLYRYGNCLLPEEEEEWKEHIGEHELNEPWPSSEGEPDSPSSKEREEPTDHSSEGEPDSPSSKEQEEPTDHSSEGEPDSPSSKEREEPTDHSSEGEPNSPSSKE
ncbi:unnamed protein product [Calypogeia fissa]